MHRWFTALLALLLTVQLSWAGAELCCVAELAEHQPVQALSNEAVHPAAAGDAHAVCDVGQCHCHHAGCAAPLADRPVTALPQHLPPEPGTTLRPKSHVPAGLERPNWLRA